MEEDIFQPGSFLVFLNEYEFAGYTRGDILVVEKRNYKDHFSAFHKDRNDLITGFAASTEYYRKPTYEELNKYFIDKRIQTNTDQEINTDYSIF